MMSFDSYSDRFGVFHNDLIQQGREMIAQALIGNGAGAGFTSLTGESRGDVHSLANVGETHLIEVVVIHVFELAFGDVEDGLGQRELAVAKGLGAGGGIQKDLALHGGFGLDELLRGAGGMGFDASAPIEIIGPAFDGAQARADFAAGGGITTTGAEFQIRAEGFKGPVGFAPGRSKAQSGKIRRRDGGDVAGSGRKRYFDRRRRNQINFFSHKTMS